MRDMLALLALASCWAVAAADYKNVTLASDRLSITVFLPPASPDDSAYYNGTRFDWSTQMGNVLVGSHVLFGHDFWRGMPHDPANPEAAVGLAEEFGCGDDGALCAAGTLHYEAGAKNGVLGYEDAGPGEAFLKIGVGKLLRPSDAVYSPFFRYEFVEYPKWDIELSKDSVSMRQEVRLNEQWCYQRQTSVRVVHHKVIVDAHLLNCGSHEFSTPHYSHNFLSLDRRPIGPPWKLSLVPNVTAKMEPGAGTWSKPIDDYMSPDISGTMLEVTHEIPKGIRIKADFIGEPNAHASNTWVAGYRSDGELLVISSEQKNPQTDLYAYNLYLERETLSPEPLQMLTLGPGGLAHWVRTLSIHIEKGDIVI